LDRGAYELIGHAYGRVAEREPWLTGAKPVAQIGLFQMPTGVLSTTQSTSGTDEGATRMLTQLKQQFDVVSETSELSRYEVLVLPDGIPVSGELRSRLKTFVKNGGGLLVTGKTTLWGELGVTPGEESPFSTTYLRFGRKIAQGVPASDHVMYERGWRVKAKRGTEVLGRVVEPYFERAWDHFSSHRQTPGDKVTGFPIATLRGRVAYISYPVFAAFATHGNYPYRLLVQNLLKLILPEPLIRMGGPTGLEATVMRQGKRTVVHLLNYAPERRTKDIDIVEDVVPLYSVPVSLRFGKRPKFVSLAPSREALIFTVRGNRVDVVVPEVRGHAMIVFE
jgi:hypothetical protein